MIICQSIRKGSGHDETSLSCRSRLLTMATVALFTALLSLSMVSPTMARGGDNDDDGLANGDENRYGTSRTIADTDGDGLRDGDEVYLYTTNPTMWDSDYDGLSDGFEVGRGTNPLDADTDDDLLNDDVEVRVYFTNPLVRDTDMDGLSDFTEVVSTGTNPLNRDTDRDNIPDGSDPFPLDPYRNF